MSRMPDAKIPKLRLTLKVGFLLHRVRHVAQPAYHNLLADPEVCMISGGYVCKGTKACLFISSSSSSFSSDSSPDIKTPFCQTFGSGTV